METSNPWRQQTPHSFVRLYRGVELRLELRPDIGHHAVIVALPKRLIHDRRRVSRIFDAMEDIIDVASGQARRR